jgi:hypothetical protein
MNKFFVAFMPSFVAFGMRLVGVCQVGFDERLTKSLLILVSVIWVGAGWKMAFDGR